MSSLEHVLAEFTAELDMEPVALEEGRPAVFRFERSGRLFLEVRNERILVYLEAPEAVREHRQLVAALAACDLRHRRPLVVRAGLSAHDRLVFGVVFEDDAFTLQALHAALDLLIKLHGEVAGS